MTDFESLQIKNLLNLEEQGGGATGPEIIESFAKKMDKDLGMA